MKKPFVRRVGVAMIIVGLVFASTPARAALGSEAITIHTLRSDSDSWASTGAITDAGPFVDPTEFLAGSSSTFHAVRVFSGEDGTFTAVANVQIRPSDDPDVAFYVVGKWAIITGTGAYADAHGGGSISEELVVATGSLVGTWTGRIVLT
jgi:hypothetical protein